MSPQDQSGGKPEARQQTREELLQYLKENAVIKQIEVMSSHSGKVTWYLKKDPRHKIIVHFDNLTVEGIP